VQIVLIGPPDGAERPPQLSGQRPGRRPPAIRRRRVTARCTRSRRIATGTPSRISISVRDIERKIAERHGFVLLELGDD